MSSRLARRGKRGRWQGSRAVQEYSHNVAAPRRHTKGATVGNGPKERDLVVRPRRAVGDNPIAIQPKLLPVWQHPVHRRRSLVGLHCAVLHSAVLRLTWPLDPMPPMQAPRCRRKGAGQPRT